MNLIFLGEDSFSAIVLESIINNGYHVALVATPLYDNFFYKRIEQIASRNNIPFVREKNINSPEFVEIVKNLGPDLIVTAHFEKLLKTELISIPALGCINLHPSLLPKYRGMAPQHWPIIHGESETGITVHFIEEGIDTGNILIQKTVPIGKDACVYDLQMQMLPLYKTIVVEAIKRIESGDRGIRQDITNGSFYGRFKKEYSEIKSDAAKLEAYNLIRAISKPYSGAIFDKNKIWKASFLNESDEKCLASQYKAIGFYEVGDRLAYLVLKDGILQIDKYEKL